MTPSFIPGLKLCKIFFEEAVKPILTENFFSLRYDAALIGPGSEVLGFDDPTSADHHWGPRLQIFLTETDYINRRNEIDLQLRQSLPYNIQGFSTHWSEPDPTDSMNQFLKPISSGLVNHRVEIYSIKFYLKKYLNIETTELTDLDWLVLPEQRLLELTTGEVYHHTLGELDKIRTSLSYYPENVWYFRLLSEWDHIAEEIAFVGRTAPRGDELGSKLEASRLVRYIIRLAFILSKKYIPYPKWFAHSFSFLPIATDLQPVLLAILNENNWRNREKFLAKAYLFLLDYQNNLQITPEIRLKPIKYHSRDQMVINVHKVIEELKKLLNPPLDKLKYPVGSVDQFINDTHILTNAKYAEKARYFYY
ncbi:MAG: DUF4037 domain-containing protein [Candidatus Hodarchaeales archaeon]|jgi:hypothetical protein